MLVSIVLYLNFMLSSYICKLWIFSHK